VLPVMTLTLSRHVPIHATAAAILLLGVLSLAQYTPAGHNSLPETAQSASASLAVQNSSEITSQSEPSNMSGLPKKKKATLRGDFVIVPIPISSPALGSGIIPVLGYIFPLSKNDTISPASVIGAAGLITDNGSSAFAVGGQLFIKHDTYRITGTFAQGNLNYNLYGIGAIAGNANVKLPLKQDGAVFLGELLRSLKWKFFVGPRVLTGHSTVTLRRDSRATVPIPPDTGLRTSLTSLGFNIQRDTRSNRFYPTNGTAFEFTSDFFANALGSKFSFQSYRTTFNKYWSLSTQQVLAYNAVFCATGGQPPFYGNCIYGTRNELRGYEAGRYLDRYMIATQLEYRLVLPKRFGLVGFGGIGGVAPGGREFFRRNAFLPAGGAGLRFMLSKTYHVNLRADFAAGKNEHTFSMGVSEAF
jgi:surface antigen Omp85-like protein